MKRIVYLANKNRETSERFYKDILALLEAGKEEEFYYILPNGEIINYYRKRLLRDLKSHFSINLFTFDDIVDNILKVNKESILGDELKYLIVARLVKEMAEKEDLNYYKDFASKDGFILSILEIIGEVKREFIRSKDFLKGLPKEPYYRELGLIYEAYENYLWEKEVLDREEVYFRAIEEIERPDFKFNIKNIYIDKFYDFRPIEMRLLKKLAKRDINIYINMDFKSRRENIVLNNSLKSLREMGFEIMEESYEGGFFKDIAYDLFSKNDGKVSGCNQVQVIEATSEYLEVKRVFEDIKLRLAKGEDLNSMSITILDPSYVEIIDQVSQVEKLPIDRVISRSMESLGLAREILNILRLGLNGKFKEALLNRLDARYFSKLDLEDKGEIFTFLKNQEIKDLAGLRSIAGSRVLDIGDRHLKILLEFISDVILEIDELLSCETIYDFNTYIRDLFEKYNLLEDLLENDDLEKLGEEAEKFAKIYEILHSLDRFGQVESSIDLKDYIILLEKYLKNKSFKVRDRKGQGLKVFDLINSRGFEFNRLYIIGLSQGKYPNIKEANFFIQEKNKRLVSKLGLKYKSYEERLDNEIIKIGELVGSAREGLVLSYTKGEDGQDTASIFLEEIVRRLEDYSLERIGFDYLFKEDLNLVTNRIDYKNFILLRLYEDNIESYSYEVKPENIRRLNRQLRPIIERNQGFGSYNGLLRDPLIIEDLEEKFKDRKFSATSLETYNRCPFSFLMDKVFGLVEVYEEDLEVDYLKIGNLYHRILRDFYEKFYREDMDDLELESLVANLFESQLEDLDLDGKIGFNRLIFEDRLEKLLTFIRMDLVRNKKEGLSPWKFEYGFGYREDFKLGDVKLYGRIDRIDKMIDGSVVIKDYKSSGGFGVKEMEEGISLQMPIYLLSQLKNKPLVAEYGLINKGCYDLGVEVKGSIKEFSKKRNNRLSSGEFQELLTRSKDLIIGSKENILRGNFQLEPKLCSEYCPYKKVCRYGGR